MSKDLMPDLDGIPDDDTVEPDDADVQHVVPAEEIDALGEDD